VRAARGELSASTEQASKRIGKLDRTGEQAIGNTLLRAIGEVIGKLASLALFAAMGRKLGQSGLGVFTFGLAFVQIATIPVDFGLDWYLLRQVAADRSLSDPLFARVFSGKLLLSIPTAIGTVLVVGWLGYDVSTRDTVYVLTAGFVFDSLARVIFSMFMAVERSGLLAVTVVLQRGFVAAAGLLALHQGLGVVTVAGCYTAGSLLSLFVAAGLLVWQIERPRMTIRLRGYGRLLVASLPFAVQDVFGVLLFKLDAVILSLMGTTVAVGRYGAAYRLFEATFFIHVSLGGAFAAMYTYLGPCTVPSIGAVFQRSMSFALIALVPLGVVFGLLPAQTARLVYGPNFSQAGADLRLLAPTVVLIGLVTLSTILIVSRTNARRVLWLTGQMSLLNVLLNVALIPSLADRGSATAMLVTEAVFLAMVLVLAARLAGGINWWTMSAPVLIAGAAMAAAMIPFLPDLFPSIAAGMIVYTLVLVGLERVICPSDYAFVTHLVRRRIPVGPVTGHRGRAR
jgi:O-antigen/teichoic acid export membrane protein